MLKFLVNSLSWLLGIAFSALLFLLLAFLVHMYAIRGFEFGEEIAYTLTMERDSYEIEFVLEEETSIADVAQMLMDLEIINHALIYRFELMLMGVTDDYEPGTFLLDKSLSTTQINARLRSRPVELREEYRVTIREGWTQRDIAAYLEYREFFTAEEFMYAANNHDFGFHFLEDLPERPSRLEGYLFPDTYFLFAGATPVQVITTMLNRFNYIYNFEYRMITEEMGFTMDQIVTIASMIEREVRVPDERPMVARVIFNRLDIGMPLQIDATVLYALDTHMERLLYTDLEVDSPFNTYRVSGLPLGPISNPGAASIHAALHPANGNWLFYVLVDQETGAHFFTHDYDQHLHARRTYMPRPWDAE